MKQVTRSVLTVVCVVCMMGVGTATSASSFQILELEKAIHFISPGGDDVSVPSSEFPGLIDEGNILDFIDE